MLHKLLANHPYYKKGHPYLALQELEGIYYSDVQDLISGSFITLTKTECEHFKVASHCEHLMCPSLPWIACA